LTPRSWSKDDIILAMWEWTEQHGRQPRANDWMKSGGDKYPSITTVYKHFNSWNAALVAAGYTPFSHVKVEFDEELAKRLRREGVTDVEIARRLKISIDVLKRLGVRPKVKPLKRNRTREQRIADLKEALKEEA